MARLTWRALPGPLGCGGAWRLIRHASRVTRGLHMRRIEEVPWHTLQHAYGTCERFPDAIRWLASADPKDRSRARNWFEELLFHQGTHYQANEFAVPFLLQAAADPTLIERERHFEFLN